MICVLAILVSLSAGADSPVESVGHWSEVIASADHNYPIHESESPAKALACCKVCTKGKPCGDTCIAQDKICHVGPGCAC